MPEVPPEIEGNRHAVLTTTTAADDEFLTARFGPGAVQKRLHLRDVKSLRVVRNPWYCGWWIGLAPHGRLFNVSGLDAVGPTLKKQD